MVFQALCAYQSFSLNGRKGYEKYFIGHDTLAQVNASFFGQTLYELNKFSVVVCYFEFKLGN